MIDWLIEWLIEWLSDWLIDWLIDWLSDWVIDWLIDWLILRNHHLTPSLSGFILESYLISMGATVFEWRLMPSSFFFSLPCLTIFPLPIHRQCKTPKQSHRHVRWGQKHDDNHRGEKDKRQGTIGGGATEHDDDGGHDRDDGRLALSLIPHPTHPFEVSPSYGLVSLRRFSPQRLCLWSRGFSSWWWC